MFDTTMWRRLEEFREKIKKIPYYRTLSLEVVSLDETVAVMRVRATGKHRNPWGTVHGGLMASLIDSACGLSVWPHLKKGEVIATVSLHMDYMAPTNPGDTITARGTLVQQSRTLGQD